MQDGRFCGFGNLGSRWSFLCHSFKRCLIVDIQSNVEFSEPCCFRFQLCLLRERLAKLLLCRFHLCIQAVELALDGVKAFSHTIQSIVDSRQVATRVFAKGDTVGHLSFEGQNVIVSGSGNVAQYCAQKCTELGGKVIAMSDSKGYIYDPNGVNLDVLFDIKQKRRARISVYADEVAGSEYVEGCANIWNVKCDIAMPCASQNEMDEAGAKALIANGAFAVFEGANMPLTPEAIAAVQAAGLLYTPGKASNAGGVATSGLEMSQNSMRMSWSFEEVDAKLKGIMQSIFQECLKASIECGHPGDMMLGANVAGFLKVADAMMAQGVV